MATLSGGLFQNNQSTSWSGGGLGAESTLALTGTQFISNTAADDGGGAFAMGAATLSGGLFQNNRSTNGYGGGLYTWSTLTLTGTQFISNTAAGDGGGAFAGGAATLSGGLFQNNNGGWGGGLYVTNTLTLTGTQFISNTAAGSGGGVYVKSGSATVGAAQILSNTAVGGGGGLVNRSTFTLVNSTVSGNSASQGGGIGNLGTLTVTNSTFGGNRATDPSQGAGGIDQYSGSATILNSTIVSNTAATASRSGIWLEAGTLNIGNSIVAQNSGTNNVAISGGTFTSLGYNLTNSGTGTPFTATGDLTNTNPLLGPLQNNGGSTWTHALLPGSPAIDRIPFGANGCGTTVTTDQRGYARPMPTGGKCDIGAYEVQSACRAQIGTGATFDSGDAVAVQAAVDAAPSGDTVKVAGTCAGVELRAGAQQTVYISKSLTLRGGYTLTNWTTSDPIANPTILDAKQGGRVAYVTGGSGAYVTLENLTVRGGSTYDNGGGIYDNDAHLTLSNAIVRDNSDWGLGGGIYVYTSSATLNVNGGQILSNTASSGGGVCLMYGSATVSGTQILNNGADGTGGLENNYGALVVVNSTVGNSHGSFGGIWNHSTLVLDNVNVISNTASQYCGGIGNDGILTMTNTIVGYNSAFYGSGIGSWGGTLTLINSTLSGNQAYGGGGAMELQRGGRTTIVNSTIVSNTAVITNVTRSGIWLISGTLYIENSIVAHNSVTNNVQIDGGTFTSLGYNLTNSSVGTPFTATGDLINTNPLLGPLQDNGGSTWTHALLPGSPAIDRIPFGVNGCGTSITADQRGQPRPGTFTHLCDVGAYEAQGVYYLVYLPLVIK